MHYIIKRALAALATIFTVSVITFFIFRILPGDPAVIMLGTEADPSTVEQLRTSLGLHRPLVIQYADWISSSIKGDLGVSYRLSMPVSALIAQRVPLTVALALSAMAITLVISIPLGVLSALRKGGAIELAVTLLVQLGLSVPFFWLGIMFILFFSLRLGWFPPGGFAPWQQSPIMALKSLVLPAIALALQRAAIMTGLVKSAFVDEMKGDYVRTAIGKGVSPGRVAYKHILKNALIPVVTITGIQLSGLLAGSIVAEQIFSLPGLGQLLVMGIGARDLPLVQGIVLFMALVVVVLNFTVDIAYSIIDPRVRFG